MMSEVHRSRETQSEGDAGEYEELAARDLTDQQQEEASRALEVMSSKWRSSEVNMTNCYKQCHHLFETCEGRMIHYDVLIAYWIMAGYVGPVDFIDEAYKKGHGLLRNSIQWGMLKTSDKDPEMIELTAASTDKLIQKCTHERSCVEGIFGFGHVLDLDRIEKVVLGDGLLKKRKGSANDKYLSRKVFRLQRGLKYVAHFNPTPNSIKPLLDRAINPSVLILRGCDQLFGLSDFTFERFKALSVLEISGSRLFRILPSLQNTNLTQLQYLHLYDPQVKKLPASLISQLRQLRWLILSGCSRLEFDPHPFHLENLQVLDLCDTSTTSIPYLSTTKLTHLFLRHSKIHDVPLPDPDSVGELSLLDLSGNQNIKQDELRISGLLVLDLSRTLIRSLGFLSYTRYFQLSHLILRECTNLEQLPRMKMLKNLEVLDMAGCQNLVDLPEDLGNLQNMKELNLSGCSGLLKLREGVFDHMSLLVKLDLSGTKIKRLPSFNNLTSLSKLSLSALKLDSLEVETWRSLSNLVELDLHGLNISTSQELNSDFLQSLVNLQILNLSKTSVAKLPDLSKLKDLRELLLADCQNLKVIPDIEPLTSLETLDLSLPDDVTIKSCHLEVEPEGQRVLPRSLWRLVLTNRSGLQKLFPQTSHCGLELLDLRGTDEIGFLGVDEERRISKPVQIHIMYDTSNQLSVFDQFVYECERVDAFISKLQYTSKNQAFKRLFETLHADWNYIRENLNRLQTSRVSKSIEELLQRLMDAVTHFSPDDFRDDSSNLRKLFQVIVKLKLLLPPPPTQGNNDQEASKSTRQNKRPFFTKSTDNKYSAAADINEVAGCTREFDHLHSSYQSLTGTEKKCLWCFSAFPCNVEFRDKTTGILEQSIVIKKRILIWWWVGEGYLVIHCGPNANPNPNPATTLSTEETLNLNTIEDIGEQMLKLLTAKGFIEPVIKKSRETGCFRMHHHVHAFVTAQAKVEGFFNCYVENNTWLTPYFTRFNKDSANTNSDEELECLKNVVTLFNINESAINIKPEWFSIMEHLSVLYLGSWHCSENAKLIDLVDQKFLEDLNKMKQLKFCSLQGLPTVRKLPKSVCKLSNLIILDLRDCTHLEELPAEIGSLKSLTHLDVTNCSLLTKLPKGISLLSKLEVLKGFVIAHWAATAHPQHDHLNCANRLFHYTNDHEVCTLRDLSKIDKLRKLSLVVTIPEFPRDEDLNILKEIRGLRKLKIVWERSISIGKPYKERKRRSESEDISKPLRWQKLKCWELQPCQNETQETPRSNNSLKLDNIEKLEMWCFPHRNFPQWFKSSELKSLEKLYIVGGNLSSIWDLVPGWNVKTLRLKYLPDLYTSWHQLTYVFPYLTYVEVHQCGKRKLDELDEEGVWTFSNSSSDLM